MPLHDPAIGVTLEAVAHLRDRSERRPSVISTRVEGQCTALHLGFVLSAHGSEQLSPMWRPSSYGASAAPG